MSSCLKLKMKLSYIHKYKFRILYKRYFYKIKKNEKKYKNKILNTKINCIEKNKL